MAASSLLLRSLALADSHRALYKAGSLQLNYLLQCRAENLNFRLSHRPYRSFSAQALEVSEPASETKNFKKKSSSREEAGEPFFSKTSKNAASLEQRDEREVFPASENVQVRSRQRYTEEEPVVNRNFERRNDRTTNDGKFGISRNVPRDFERGRGGFSGRNGGFAIRESADTYSRRNGRGSREEFSNVGNEYRANRWNVSSDAEGRNGWSARNDAGRRGFRDGYAYDKPASRSEGIFRKEFGDSVDTSKGVFRNRNQGGSLGKKQFPDMDGGKRLFKGRFAGNGFVKKQMERNEGGNNRKRAYGTPEKGQSFLKVSSGAPMKKQFEDNVEGEASSEDDEEDVKGFPPQAGGAIRYSQMISASRGSSRRQLPRDVNESEDEVQDKYEAHVELDEDDNAPKRRDSESAKRRDSESGRRRLPMPSLPLPKIIGEVVYGVGPVYAALQTSRREFFCLYVQQNMPIAGGNTGKKKDKKAVEWIIRTAVGRGLEVKEVTKHDLNMLADNKPHQGLILDASPLELVVSTYLEAPFVENGKAPVWVALDEVTDPQNFGAILRSAYFLGAKGVVVCAKNSAPLSAVVGKASAGALEVLELRSCKNMVKFLNRSTENGWRVVGGSAVGTDATSVREVPRGLPTILVLGGEGKGLRTSVKGSCSELVCIPGLASESHGKIGSLLNKVHEAVDTDAEVNEDHLILRGAREDFIAVESLNVSVAAGILLHELLNNQAATESSNEKYSEVDVETVPEDDHVNNSECDVEAVLVDEEKKNCESDVEVVLGHEQEQHSEIVVEAALGDEQEQHCGSDLEVVLGNEERKHTESDVVAVLGDEQEQHSESDATAVLGDEQEQHFERDVKAVLDDVQEQNSDNAVGHP